jgi:hypothetical protein
MKNRGVTARDIINGILQEFAAGKGGEKGVAD